MLEAKNHKNSSVWRLSYEDDKLPIGTKGFPTLQYEDVASAIKVLRTRLARRGSPKIRVYYAGEYAPNTGRPHYHCIIYGLALSDWDLVQSIWPHGYVHGDELNFETASYVAQYTLEKRVGKESIQYSDYGVSAEEAKMSRRPGIAGQLSTKVVQSIIAHGCVVVHGHRHTIPSYIQDRFLPYSERLFIKWQGIQKHNEKLIRDRSSHDLPEVTALSLDESIFGRSYTKRLFDSNNDCVYMDILRHVDASHTSAACLSLQHSVAQRRINDKDY